MKRKKARRLRLANRFHAEFKRFPSSRLATNQSRLPSARWGGKILRNEMQRVENYLKVLLQAFGAATAIAVVPFVMPRSWMAVVHEWLGIGELPDKPVVEYLARTTSEAARKAFVCLT